MPGRRNNPAKRPGEGLVGGWPTSVLILSMIALAALALYGIWAFWPSEPGRPGGLPPAKDVNFFGYEARVSRETLFFVIVALSGALGGLVHGIRSLAVYVGNRELRWSWIPFYLLKPVLGAVLATLLYFVLRAGLFSPSASTQQASPYGFAAISALAGLFSDQAVEKLKKVAEEVFEKVQPTKDSIETLPLATTGAAEPSGPTDARVNGGVNPRGNETSVHFEYGSTDQYGDRTPATSLGAVNDVRPVHAELMGLVPDTVYHYRVVAENAAGTGYGEDREFRTPAS